MSKALIVKLRKDRDSARATVETILKKEETGTELTDAEKTNMKALVDDATSLDARIKELTELETARIEAENLDIRLDNLTHEKATFQIKEKEITTLGMEITKAEFYSQYVQAPSGRSPIHESQFALVSTIDANTKNLVSTSRARDAAMPTYSTPLLDACGYQPVSGNAVDWIEWPTTVPLGAIVAEGAVKPEAVYAPVLRNGTLDKIAHHVPVTREMLEDVPRARSIIEGALVQGVRNKAESVAAAQLVAATLPTSNLGATLLESIRTGVAYVQNAGFQPSTLVLNPLDYAAIDIQLLGITLAGARANSPVWGLNIVPAGAVAAGTAYVGDFNAGMTLFDRGILGVYITDSHAAEFVSNILRILAEARMKAVVTRPEAIVECTKSGVVREAEPQAKAKSDKA